jgi:hypothetical protein
MKIKTTIATLLLCSIAGSVFAIHHINNAELEKVAYYIESSIENNNPSFINLNFQYEHFCAAFVNTNASHSEFNSSFVTELESYLTPGNLVLDQAGSVYSYQFVSSFSEGDKTSMVFRLQSEGGLDYHEYTLVKEEGNYRIIDLYMFYDGTRLSEQIAELYQVLSETMLPEIYKKKNAKDTKQHLQAEKKMLNNLAGEDFSKATKQWQKLDIKLRNKKSILLYALRAASYTDATLTKQIFDKINVLYPETEGAKLIVLEGLFIQKEYNQTLKYIDQLDEAVHTDPYLNYLRASVYKNMQETERAEWLLNKCIVDLPRSEAGYFSLLELYLESERYTDATSILTQITENLGFLKDDLNTLVQNYPEFASSQEYTMWITE